MLLVLILVLASSVLARGEESAAGRWEGSVQIPGNDLRLIVDFEQRDRGVWIGSIIIPRFNVKGAALTISLLKDRTQPLQSRAHWVRSVLNPQNSEGTFPAATR
jgi:hypothetical protein